MKTLKTIFAVLFMATFLFSCEAEGLELTDSESTNLISNIDLSEPHNQVADQEDIDQPNPGSGRTDGEDDMPDPDNGGTDGEYDKPDPNNGRTDGEDDMPDPDGGTDGEDDMPDPDEGETDGEDDMPDPEN